VAVNPLRKENDPKNILNALNRAKNEGKPVIVWRLIGSSKKTSEAAITMVCKYSNELTFKVNNLNVEDVKSIISGSNVVNFYVPDESFLFQAEVKSFSEDNVLSVCFPTMVAQVERRKYFRLEKMDGIIMRTNFYIASDMGATNKVQLFEKDCFDLSAGGLSFIITKLEKKFFNIDDIVAGIHLMFGSNEVVLNGKIVNFIPIEPNQKNNLLYKGYKVCIEFIDISDLEKQKVNLFVFRFADVDQVS
jgi:c-di-GMP-binding flagellar brake protein YcgR